MAALASTSIDLTLGSAREVSRFFKNLFGLSPQRPRRERLADRLSYVSRLNITPMKMVGYEGDRINFSALPVNFADQTIQGVRVEWESSNPDIVQIDNTGQAVFLQPGRARITCRAGAVWTSAPVLVRPGQRPYQTDDQWRTDQSGLKLSDSGSGASASLTSMIEKALSAASPTVEAQSSGGYDRSDFAYDETWSEARNVVGSPHDHVTEGTRMGAVMPFGSNFNTAIPIIGLGGRGLGAGVTLFYNSRVWSRHGNAVTFDPVASWPSPGFSLGFGRIVTYAHEYSGINLYRAKYMLVGADGTRRYLGQSSWNYGAVISGQTSDGTHISFSGNFNGMTVNSNDGTKVSYTRINNRLLPDRIQDSNGNYVQITYRVPVYDENMTLLNPPLCPALAIDYITDTLGRRIQFNYDSNGVLTSISAPAFGGTSQNPLTRTLVNFDYQNISITNSFSGLTVENSPGTAPAIRHVYFPATDTGYKFDYSAYGMIYNYSARRSMTINGTIISDGSERAATSFNYPTVASSLTDAPAFTQRTESATNSPASQFNYSTTTDSVAQTRTFIITQPDGSQVLLTRSTNGLSAGIWRLIQSEIKNSGGVSFAKSIYTYANDGGGSPQVQSVTSYDDAGQPTLVWFEYDQYGNMIVKREYGHQVGGQFLARRRTRLTYKTDTAYINAYLRSLVVEAAVYDGLLNSNDLDDVMIAKSTMTYDDYNAMGGMEVYTGQPAPPGHDSTYDATKTVRGNVTATTEWIDLATNNFITRLRKVDKFGNTVKEQVSCCNERSYMCDETNCWSSPEQVTSGNTSGLYLTTTADEDFNTGAVERQEDANGDAVNFAYDEAMRPVEATTDPASATAEANFNDGALSASGSVTYDDGGTQKTVTASTEYDGWGRAIKSISASGTQVNTVYDSMGRVTSSSNPFQSGGSPQYWTAFQYDTLGRATVTTLPDSNTAQTTYSGLTVTTTDQVNRKMKRESDSLGRLVKVTEQDSSGTLTQDTSYTYDLLDRLTQVNQGNQTRGYKYDGLGRLLYERIPEQTATINDGTGTLWSCKYTYTDFNAVLTKTDARGAVTTFGYDTLNRVTSISYNVASAPGVSATPSVIYQYDNNQASATTGLVTSVLIGSGAGAAGGSEENYSYDSLGRISSLQRRINVSPSVIRSYTSSYQYNDAGQAKQITYPSSRLVQPVYDNKGRISSIGGSANHVQGVTYDTIGRASGMTLGNGVVESMGYDSQRMQMTSQTAVKGATTLMSLTYGFQATAGQMGAGSTAGNAGQLMSVTGSIGGQTESAAYTYDLLGRLVTSNQTTNSVSAQRRFVYDRWGNRTSVYDATTGGNQIQSVTLEQSGGVPTNRITSVAQGGIVNYTYDAAGNVTSDGAHSYTYDAENRLVSVDGGATATYGYDQSNRRIKKTIGGTATHCVWEGAQIIAENNAASGAVNVEYVYSGSRMVASIASGVTRYHLADRLSARVTLDTSGNIVGRQAHLPFGEELNATGTTDKHRFTSYERDSETGTDQAVNRQYGQNAGRFMRVDPKASSARLGSPQSLNRYSYALNEPVNQTDPLGLDLDNPFPDWPPFSPPGTPAPPHLPGGCASWRRNCEDGSSGFGGGIIDDGYGGSGGGRNNEGPASWRPPFGPPARPTCDIAVSGRGYITGGVPLTFPDGSRDRRLAYKGLHGDVVDGWFWNIEIFARVSDNVKNWKIRQEVNIYFTGSRIEGGKFRTDSSVYPYPRDGPPDGYWVKIPGHTWLFWIDAPGLAYERGVVPIDLTIRFVGRSWIEQGRNQCSVGWVMVMVWREGRFVKAESSFTPERESF